MNGAASPSERFVPPLDKKQTGNKHDNMFPIPQWRDLWAAVLFYAHFIGFIAVSVYAFIQVRNVPITEKPGGIEIDGNMLRYFLISFASAAATAVGLTVLTLGFMKSAPETMLHTAFIMNCVLSVGIAVWAFVAGAILPGVILSIMAVITIVFYFAFRNRIPFSAILLQTVLDCLKAYPSMLLVTSSSVVISVIYMAYFASTFGALGVLHDRTKDPYAQAMMIYSAFSLFWTSQVLTNTAQTSIAGVYATYYFLHGTGQAIINPVASSLRRATTYSFGSICFGSLIVAIIQTIRFLLQMATNRDSIAGAVVDCILGLLQGLVEYFNYFAYTQIAIYGKPYIQAAKDTWNLVKSRGVDAIVNDDLIGTCLGISSFTIGIASGLVVYIISTLIYAKPWDESLVIAVVFGLLSIIIPAVAFEVIGAGATTTFVCLAEDPEALQRSKPHLYNAIMEKYSMITF
ncbi:Choline transporter-like domain-containing protein [Paramicrosporidium saccamoebae]|uniref:Protein PNS1 n=1 Tax=Paramicrosporidium saccamoebae TaxID=1246581 RepID=A0A2H9TIC3_9FUNG|nr:Choline transporter-like domain-containing protein [Paramicrosporidium saccamoebae]